MPARNVVAADVTSLASLVAGAGIAAAEPEEPNNVGDAKAAATAYYDSGAYQHDLAEVAAKAINWIGNQAPTAPRAAVVFDIDETALSNWEVIRANDFGRFVNGPCDLPGVCAWRPWDLTARSTAIQPMLDTYNTAKTLGAAVFFITGRDEGQGAATEQNLQSVGYTGYTRLVMTSPGARYASAADFKAPQRCDRSRGLYDRREHRRPAVRPGWRPLAADVLAARPVLPHPLRCKCGLIARNSPFRVQVT